MGKLFEKRNRCTTGEALHKAYALARARYFILPPLERYDAKNAHITRDMTRALEALSAHDAECVTCAKK